MNAVRVRWPSGRTQRAPDVVADSLLTVYENPRHSPTGRRLWWCRTAVRRKGKGGPLRVDHIGRILTERGDGADELHRHDSISCRILEGDVVDDRVVTDVRDSLMKVRKIEATQRTICPS